VITVRTGIAVRAVSACYALMAAVTVLATAVGFWLSYAGLHSFAARAGLSGPEAWAWPSSVDLFILAGELGITVSALRDGATDWRAWVYFAAGAGPSAGFNVLHVTVTAPAWGKYAVAAAPPVAAVLALAALMQQVLSLPAALAHLRGRTILNDPERSRTAADAVPSATAGDSRDDGATPPTTGSDKVRDILKASPALPKADVAEMAGVSQRTVERVKRQLVLAGANGHGAPETEDDRS
jgi:hypothetical protein